MKWKVGSESFLDREVDTRNGMVKFCLQGNVFSPKQCVQLALKGGGTHIVPVEQVYDSIPGLKEVVEG